VSSPIPSRGHPEWICANKYEQHKFAIADLLHQMDLAAPDKQRRRDQATALFTRLAEDRFSAARRSTTFAGHSTRRLSRTRRRYFRSALGRLSLEATRRHSRASRMGVLMSSLRAAAEIGIASLRSFEVFPASKSHLKATVTLIVRHCTGRASLDTWLQRGFSLGPAQKPARGFEKERSMNLVVWLPAMFALGLASLGVCLVFTFACEQI
jgi:hypothetical protein